LSITLLYRVQLIGFWTAIALCAVAPLPVHASEASGEVGVRLVDPLVIDIKEAKRFCKEEPQTVKCDILREQLKGKKLKAKVKSLNNRSYNILSANFE
jgi:hypothetical protein